MSTTKQRVKTKTVDEVISDIDKTIAINRIRLAKYLKHKEE